VVRTAYYFARFADFDNRLTTIPNKIKNKALSE